MLYVFGFDKIGVAIGDLYFFDRSPAFVDQGAEHGVRLEVRMVDKSEPHGSAYGSRQLLVNEPIWRVDMLETVVGDPGSHNRTHHHPGMKAWEGGERIFEDELLSDPVGYVTRALSDLGSIMVDSDFTLDDVGPTDAQQLRDAAPEIAEVVGRLLKRVESGELGREPEVDPGGELVRTGWM